MVIINDGVVVVGNRYIRRIIRAGEQAYGEIGLPLTLTAGLDRTHSTVSYHYQGRALDFRIWGVRDPQALVARIRALLPAFYDVVLYADHIHVEADAKKEFAQ